MSFCDEHGTADYCGECVYGPEIERLTAERDAAQAEVRELVRDRDTAEYEARALRETVTELRAEARELRAELARVREDRNRYLHAARCAYGLLWQELADTERVREARRLLLEALPDEERKCGIHYAMQRAGLTEAEIAAAISQPAEQHDPLAVSDHCGECGEPEPECACDERESPPLMARRSWMRRDTDRFVVHGDFCLEVESFRGKAPHYEADGSLIVIGDSAVCDQVDAEAQPDGIYRIADTDERGLPVIERTADMPKRAKYRLSWITQADAAGGDVEYTDSLPLALEANRSGAVSERIEDYRPAAQESGDASD